MTRLLALSLVLATAGCASTGAVPRPFPGPAPAAAATSAPAPSPAIVPAAPPAMGGPAPLPGPAAGYALAGTALALRGVPYRNGGSDPSGFDCSGFVWYVFAQHGVKVPRTVTEQYRAGVAEPGQPEPGDLVFFTTTAAGPSHVGILIGGDQFIHAPSSTGQVRVERLSAPYWGSRYLGARRALP